MSTIDKKENEEKENNTGKWDEQWEKEKGKKDNE